MHVPKTSARAFVVTASTIIASTIAYHTFASEIHSNVIVCWTNIPAFFPAARVYGTVDFETRKVCMLGLSAVR